MSYVVFGLYIFCFLEFCVSPRHSPHPPHHLYGTGWLGAQQYGAEGAALSSQPSPGPPDSLNGAEGAALGSQSEPSTSYIAIPVYTYTGLECRRPLTLFFSFFDHTGRRRNSGHWSVRMGLFYFCVIAHHNGEGRGGSGRVGVGCEGLWSHTRALLHHN